MLFEDDDHLLIVLIDMEDDEQELDAMIAIGTLELPVHLKSARMKTYLKRAEEVWGGYA